MVVTPADSKLLGVWSITEGYMLERSEGIVVKSKCAVNVRELIDQESAYADASDGGNFTHAFLDVNDYHRYHFLANGTIVEVPEIPGHQRGGRHYRLGCRRRQVNIRGCRPQLAGD